MFKFIYSYRRKSRVIIGDKTNTRLIKRIEAIKRIIHHYDAYLPKAFEKHSVAGVLYSHEV